MSKVGPGLTELSVLRVFIFKKTFSAVAIWTFSRAGHVLTFFYPFVNGQVNRYFFR